MPQADKARFGTRNCVTEVTIATGGTVSSTTDLFGTELVKLLVPAAFTGTAIRIQVSYDDGVTWCDLEFDGEQYAVEVLAARTIPSVIALSPPVIVGLSLVRVVSNGAEAAARTVSLVSRPI